MKGTLLWMGAVLMLAVGMNSCSDDEKEYAGYDPNFNVRYFDQNPDLDKRQGYWFNDKFIELIPQKEPPYYLMVKWDSDLGERALNYIANKNDGVVQKRHDPGEKNMAIILCNKYISCPYLYISSSYTTTNVNEFIGINCKIVLKMKEGKSVEPIAEKYVHTLMLYTGEEKLKGLEIFDCILNTSYEVLQLAEEINQRDDVEWAEPDMYLPIHTF